MTDTPDEDFADFLTKFGQPFAAKAADEAVLQKYRGILPDQLLTYWRQYGFCGFADGLRPLQKSPSPDNRNPKTGFRLFPPNHS